MNPNIAKLIIASVLTIAGNVLLANSTRPPQEQP